MSSNAPVQDWIQHVSLRLDRAMRAIEGGDAMTLDQAIDTATKRLSAATSRSALPIGRLRARLGLSATEELIAWTLVAQQLDVNVAAKLNALSSGPEVTYGALRDVVYGAFAPLAIDELGPRGRLTRYALVQRSGGGQPEVAWTRRSVRATDRLLSLALGAAELEGMEYCETLVVPAQAIDEQIADQVCSALERRALVVLRGGTGTGRATMAAIASTRLSTKVLAVDVPALLSAGAGRDAVRSIARECQLFDVVPVLRDADVMFTSEHDGLAAELLDLVDGAVVATASRNTHVGKQRRGICLIDMTRPAPEMRESIWQAHLPYASRGVTQEAAIRFAVSPAAIAHAGRALAGNKDVCVADVQRALADHLVHELDGLAERIDWKLDPTGLVLADEQREQLISLVSRIKQRTVVMDRWGFAEKLAKGLGVTALFSGPPGTGKTMVAALVAFDLGIDLYRVDLSKVVSKYIGETEKQLATLFDAAEGGHIALLFDEADALFAKRTEVKSSNDRHANQLVNFLLQRLETFEGVAILTTNHETAVDDAFRRRLAVHVRFPIPDEHERAQLWRSTLPTKAALASDVDFDRLGSEFAMSGGYIRNAVLRAAFVAADCDEPIGMQHLWSAARSEYEAMGKLATQDLA